MSIPISNLGTTPSLTIGGRVMTDLSSNLITLVGLTSSNGKCTLRKPGAASGYQVTAGKTLTIIALVAQSQGTSNAGTASVAYSDNDVGIDSSSSLTNPVYWSGSSQASFSFGGSAIGQQTTINPNFGVIAQKYFSINSNASVGITYIAYGYEA